MTEEDKNLLLIDLCGRLPYGVKVEAETWLEDEGEYTYVPDKVYSINSDGYIVHGYDEVYECKPYLFPISSLTEKQKEEYHHIVNYISPDDTNNWAEGEFIYVDRANYFEELLHFYNRYHIDYRGLIEKGLAIDATDKNIY